MANAAYYAFANNPIPTCRFFRTVNTRLVDTQGAAPNVIMEVVVSAHIEKGIGPSLLGLQEIVSGGGNPDPCPAGTLIVNPQQPHIPSLTPTYARSRDGSAAANCITSSFNGYIECEFSNEVFISDIEAAVQILNAQADFGALASGTGNRLIEWHNDLIRTTPTDPQTACGGSGANGIYTGSGNASNMLADGLTPIEQAPYGNSNIGTSHLLFGSLWTMFAISWQTRISPPSAWCRRNGTITRPTGFPGVGECSGFNAPPPSFGCVQGSKIQQPTGGTFIITPGSAPMQFTNVGYGFPGVCA